MRNAISWIILKTSAKRVDLAKGFYLSFPQTTSNENIIPQGRLLQYMDHRPVLRPQGLWYKAQVHHHYIRSKSIASWEGVLQML